ncbi:MAG: ATP-binding protein [Oscillospiraceae bacterium]|nr:ATP-binding protein [Oscillospiraceae bacterium]
MALDGKILYRARTIFEENKKIREAAHIRRVQSVYEECPRIMELDNEIRNSITEVIGIALSHGKNVDDAIDAVKTENLRLQEERKAELQRLGHPGDYLDEKPACDICGDTGYSGGKVCRCLMAIYTDEQRKELSKLLKMGVETFESFRLDLYDDIPDPNTGISPRQTMTVVYEYCRAYASAFGEKSPSLLFTGGTGLGKTFLSAAIAKVVSEKGFSVVYEPACDLFAAFESVQFNRSDSDDSEINRYMTCDLLILDDLGTELTTAFTNSALYSLVNTRLVSGKKTVISTNLTRADIRRRYSPQIVSRLEGEYKTLVFAGRDIRLLK